MKTVAIILAAALGIAPPSKEPEHDAILLQPGDTAICTSTTGCVITTPENLRAALETVANAAARSCLRSI